MNTEKFFKAFNKSNNNKGDKLKSNNALNSNNSVSSSNYLTATTESVYRLYSKDTLRSIKLPNNKFTNFLNKTQIGEYKIKVVPLINNLKKLSSENKARMYSINLTNDIEDILNNYLNQPDFDKFKNEFKKYNILDSLEQITKYRIFFYKDIIKNEYVIFLIDPHHLVIPDKLTKKQQTYQKNINNNICISTCHK